MSDNTDLQAWVARAEEDYVLARSALRRKKPLTYGATFHAQQCAEKYLKAALLAKGQAFPKTHDLLALSHLCTQAGLLLEIDADLLDTLSSLCCKGSVPWRRPDA